MSKESLKRWIKKVGYWNLLIVMWAYVAIICVPVAIVSAAILSTMVFPYNQDFTRVFKRLVKVLVTDDLREVYSLYPIREWKKKVDKRMKEHE